jgi:hypothetical protein
MWSYDMTFEPNRKVPVPPLPANAPAGGYAAIFGLVAAAIVAMGLLAFGYNNRESSQTAQTATVPKAASASDQMSSPSQPRANGANTPAAPTASTTGVGSSNGSK